eukprot:CAMPEP_0202339096 /NCGR_PEP_ID=MMETSP1126-20121109/1110_1 /ASSEMBLY_ACC=CAM_ASM_000457 /TAXON_ID=3047 /ORGANISM="Dunaliella tertiolecta, Strain CCMP1320" /LENGTH=124 /DNA_ID=CAMNT_0048929609 /DNA_START=267 /DNA_END=642 /DNA_ORIENTATION=-
MEEIRNRMIGELAATSHVQHAVDDHGELAVEDGDVTKWFIKKHAALATFWNFVLFDFSILLPLVSIVMFSSYTYSFAAGYVLVALCTVIFAISVAVWLWADYQRWFKLRDLAKARTQERLVHPV